MSEKIQYTKTAVLRGKEKLTIENRKLPEIDEHSVLVKIKACNICTSEYGVYNGSRTSRPYPLVFGHEWSGEILEVGSKVYELKKGDYVACGYQFDPYTEASKEGRTSECPHLITANDLNSDGYYGNAGFAEYVVKPEVQLYKIKKGVDPAIAGLLEPISTVIFGLNKLRIKRGETIVVVGAGTMGIINALIAREYGCRVIISELLPKKITVAKNYGFEVINAKECDPIKKVMELTDGKGADAVILAVGAQKATDQSFEMIKQKRGRILLFAASYPSPKINIDVNTIHYRKMEIIGTFGADYRDFREGQNLINSGKIDFSPVIESRFSFDKMEDAMKAACVLGAYRICVEMK